MSAGSERSERPARVGPRLYAEFAAWWPLLSAPADYAEEAAFYRDTLLSVSRSRPRSLLEIGCGGGNNAFHLKNHFELTLVDASRGMLAVSRLLNPECEHHLGDMRSVRLGWIYDAVFIHDAIMYMTTEADLALAVETAFVHCRPGGVALFAPDHVRETYRPRSHCGGHDGAERSMRYLEWEWDPDPADTETVADFAYLLREGTQAPRVEYDRHVMGLFPRRRWLELLAVAGFKPSSVPFEHSEIEPGSSEVFVGLRP